LSVPTGSSILYCQVPFTSVETDEDFGSRARHGRDRKIKVQPAINTLKFGKRYSAGSVSDLSFDQEAS